MTDTPTPGTPSTEQGREHALYFHSEDCRAFDPLGGESIEDVQDCNCGQLRGILAIEDEAYEQGREDGMTHIRAARDEAYAEAARAASEQVAALREALEPWLRHKMGCAATEGYGVRDGVRLTPQKPCDCGLDRAALASPAPSPAREPLDVERLAKALWANSEVMQEEGPYEDASQSDREYMAQWAGDIAAEYARLSDNP